MATPSARKTSTPATLADSIEAPATPAVVEVATVPVPAEIPPVVLWRLPSAGVGPAGNPHLTRHEAGACSLAFVLQRPAGSPVVTGWPAGLDGLVRQVLTSNESLAGLLAEQASLRERIANATRDLFEVDTRLAAVEGSLNDPALSDSPNLGQRLRELHEERDRLQASQREGKLVLDHFQGQADRLGMRIGSSLGPVAEAVLAAWLAEQAQARQSLLAELAAACSPILERFLTTVAASPPDVSAARESLVQLAGHAAGVRLTQGYIALNQPGAMPPGMLLS